MEPLLKIEHLSKSFPVRSGFFGKPRAFVKAVNDVTFDLMPGETLALVGESGCGKTTLGRTVLRLTEPDAGNIFFDGTDITSLNQQKLREFRLKMQMIFQDPYFSLNPRLTVLDLIGEALQVHGLVKTEKEKEARVAELLSIVGLSPDILHLYPHEFSGGQRQRIAIARATALRPKLIVCDEAVSALDVSVQAQILKLLAELSAKMEIAYLFISHDLAVVRHIAQRLAVMYLGQIVEFGTVQEVFQNPRHPYTEALLSSVLLPDITKRRKRIILKGEISRSDTEKGCVFASRCPKATASCHEQNPTVRNLSATHWVKCSENC